MHFLEVRNVVKNYAGHLALDDVNISVPTNTIFGLLGPNGAGKTTLIRIINQITAPDSGSILFEGHPLKSQHIERIGYLPEERGLYKKMKVGEQALYLAQLKGTPKHEALKKLKFWFQRFEIEQWWGKKVEELSKGMQQKIQFITTVLHNPSLLIFDEPFSGFDPINANILKEEILNLKSNGATIIFSTHNMGSVEELCDNITLINNGKAILSGNVNELRQKYRKNIARLDFSGNTEEISAIIALDFQIIETSQTNNITSKLIQLPHSSKINDLLKSVINKCHIHSCQEILPGMNEIFIDTVTSSK